ncbi:MAG: B12-binding domain-containing radical SAM protein [Deltaproteobacteria bacterium]|nr:B12-binding domain-containing radical SAM protein [Deltaproteobacteria bacterium]MBW1920531.1 B12-binding domain-containing radical SAM protein [Deltaproteobacteria bacterium]MBW1935701.1 B12-binding domain-containing radical SAM protein [Deltaproteobacteria bacterium]MBW1978417.1 B12-binding domain-containing radical SAM protein [Deltaproteobacteria bacterium]MBW2045414.1 B12-binding domain-containing radical SAM protein [Deltaproteobacteria bacterium]
MHYEGTCIRPPSEAYSILLQVTVGCSHNKCTFCGTYKDKRFRIKDEKTILSDILFASKYMKRQDRVFLMDGDGLIIPQKRLMWILDRINEHLPWVKRVGTYANTKSIKMKSLEDLIQLRKNGLGIIYLGVETGDDVLRKKIRKGSSAETCIEMGKRVKQAGIKLSVTVLLGIAGRDKSLEHARATGALLSKMDPDYVGALTVMLIPGTPLYEDFQSGKFQLPNERELLVELREMLAHTNLTRGLFFSNHASNYLPVKARLPRGKQEALDLIDRALRGEVGLRPEWMRAL